LNFDGKVADQFAMGGVAAPFQEKVPTPGRLESDGPAIEGPRRIKARARTKLVVRTIKSLPFRKSAAPFDGNLIPKGCFRMSALEAKNGFVTAENCFVGTRRRNIRFKISNVFRMKAGRPREARACGDNGSAQKRSFTLPIDSADSRLAEAMNLEAGRLTKPVHVQLLWAVARYPRPPGQGLQSWAMATHPMLAARPLRANLNALPAPS
jgi:hypothetical protein